MFDIILVVCNKLTTVWTPTKNCSFADSFFWPYGVTRYDSGWRKDVVNQCLEFATAPQFKPGTGQNVAFHVSSAARNSTISGLSTSFSESSSNGNGCASWTVNQSFNYKWFDLGFCSSFNPIFLIKSGMNYMINKLASGWILIMCFIWAFLIVFFRFL